MKLEAQLSENENSFQLDLNEEDIHLLERKVENSDNEEDTDEEGQNNTDNLSHKISAAVFNVNDKAIMDANAEKSFDALKITIDRKLKENGSNFTENMEKILINDLKCSSRNFVHIMEMMYQQITRLGENTLQELTLDGLPSDLIIRDCDLIERFGRSAQNVSSLSIGNARNIKTLETRKALANLALIILSGASTPSKLRLQNFGFDLEDG